MRRRFVSGLACVTVVALGACGAAKTTAGRSSTPFSTYSPEPGATPGSLGTATLSGAVEGQVRAALQVETSCIPGGYPASTDVRGATWEHTSQQGTPSVVTHWITVDWTTAEVGKTVALTPDHSADPPRVGVQYTDAGSIERQWVSTSGSLTILAGGTSGHVNATLSPDEGIGPGVHDPGSGTVVVQAAWTC